MSSHGEALREAIADYFRRHPLSCPACASKALGCSTDDVRSYIRPALELGHEFYWTATECECCRMFKNVIAVKVPAEDSASGPTEDGRFRGG